MNPIEVTEEAVGALVREFPVDVEAALSLIRTYGGVEQARRFLEAWRGGGGSGEFERMQDRMATKNARLFTEEAE